MPNFIDSQVCHMDALLGAFFSCTKRCSQKLLPILASARRKLNGAASRLMIFFFAELSEEVLQEHGLDVYRLGFEFRNLLLDLLCICFSKLLCEGGSVVLSMHWPLYLQCLQQMGVALSHVICVLLCLPCIFIWVIFSVVSQMAAGQGKVLSCLLTGRLWSNNILHTGKTTTVPCLMMIFVIFWGCENA